MRKGLKSTLMTVAVALLGLKAMAMAPTIGTIPDVIIGDANASTASNLFVYSGALNGNTLVTDDTTSAGGIKWVFTNTGGHYSVNGRTESSGLTPAQMVNPDAAHDLTQGDDPDSTDSDKLTFTFRNINYSPIGGPNSDPGAAGVQDGQVMALVASDGTTLSQPKSFMAFIDNDGPDRLSGSPPAVNVYDQSFTDGLTHGWVAEDSLFGASSVTNTNNANGLCANASAQGVNISGWVSQTAYNGTNATYNTISMTNNSVYEVRVTVSTTAQAGLVPMWYIASQNTLDWYGGTYIIFDNGINNTAGANSPLTRATFTELINAPAMNTASFQAAVTNPSNATFKDFRLKLQTLDVGSAGNDPYGAAADQGQLCWSHVVVNKVSYSGLQTQAPDYQVTNLTQAVNAAPGVANTDPNAVSVNNFSPSGIATVTFTNGDVQMMPTSSTAWEATGPTDNSHSAFFQILPGDSTNGFTGTADMLDNYPVVWDADQAYQVSVTLQAPNALGETNPPDYFYVGMDVPTNELINDVYTTTKLGLSGMPKQTAQDFVAFFHGNGGSTATGNFKRFRPHVYCGTVPAFVDLDPPNGTGGNAGGIQFNGWSVSRVSY
jgi:hypothetical protein